VHYSHNQNIQCAQQAVPDYSFAAAADAGRYATTQGCSLNKFVVLFLIFSLSACYEDSESIEQAHNIFPSTLEYQQCLKNMDPSDSQYHKVVIEFDSNGYSGLGWAIYYDADCEIIAYRNHDVNSHYPHRLGNQVINQDGTIGNELIFPDPENAGKHGTVYHIDGSILCFAVGTLILNSGYTNRPNLSSINFTSTSIEGNFSKLEIDRTNCFIIKTDE